MLSKQPNEGFIANTKRGKPFEKGNQQFKKRKNTRKDLVDSGLESSDERAIVKEEIIKDNNTELEIKEELETNEKETINSFESIECLDFHNKDNKLSIKLFKKHNRMFRVQIFLNDSNEIRPMTFTGSSTALSFWKLLKEALKK